MAVLVDTSVWIEYLARANEQIAEELDELLLRGEVATAGLVLAELRHGCRRHGQVKTMLEAVEPLLYLEVDRDDWLRAGEIAADAGGKGYPLEVADCLLAALALRNGWSVFSLNRDFQRIPGLKLYRLRVV